MGAVSVVPLSLLPPVLPDPLLPDPLLPLLSLLPCVGLGIGGIAVVALSLGSGIGATLVVVPSLGSAMGATSVVLPSLVVSPSSSSHAGIVSAIASDARTSARPRGRGVNLVLVLITTRSSGTHNGVRGQAPATTSPVSPANAGAKREAPATTPQSPRRRS